MTSLFHVCFVNLSLSRSDSRMRISITLFIPGGQLRPLQPHERTGP